MPDALGRLWRVAGSWRGDAMLALVLVGILLSFDALSGLPSGRHDLGAACAAGVCGCLVVRRAHPGWAAVVAALLLGVMGAAGSASGQPFDVLFVAAFVLANSLGADGRLARSGLALILLIAGLQLAVGQFNPFVAMVTAGPWAAGLVARSRRRMTEQLTARGRELEAERELFAAESVRYERARIARELHDIVAHCVSVMVIQASAGQRLTGTDPPQAAEAFDAIGEAARQAQAEIGRLAGLLDCDPPPGGTDWMRLVDELVARASAAGLAVTCRFAGTFAGLSPGAAETAYRLIQESLTNALKHAPGTSADITIHGTGGHVEVDVVNGPPGRRAVRAGARRGRPRASRDARAGSRLRRRPYRRPGRKRRMDSAGQTAPPRQRRARRLAPLGILRPRGSAGLTRSLPGRTRPRRIPSGGGRISRRRELTMTSPTDTEDIR